MRQATRPILQRLLGSRAALRGPLRACLQARPSAKLGAAPVRLSAAVRRAFCRAFEQPCSRRTLRERRQGSQCAGATLQHAASVSLRSGARAIPAHAALRPRCSASVSKHACVWEQVGRSNLCRLALKIPRLPAHAHVQAARPDAAAHRRLRRTVPMLLALSAAPAPEACRSAACGGPSARMPCHCAQDATRASEPRLAPGSVASHSCARSGYPPGRSRQRLRASWGHRQLCKRLP